MDKTDVEMEDAENKVHDVQNSVVESIDSSLKPEGPAVAGQQSTESLVECQENAKTGTEDQNNHPESGDKSPIPAENGNGEQNSNVVEGEGNANDDTMNQNDSKAVVEDQRNAASETATIGQPETQGNTAVDDQNNATGGTEGETIIEEKKEGVPDADVALKKEEPIGNVAHHDTRGVDMQVHEELPANEVGDSGKEVKEAHQAENSIKDVHQNGIDMMVDEQKKVEHKTNTASVISDRDDRSNELSETKDDVKNTATAKMPEPATPNLSVKCDTANTGQHTGEASNKIFDESKMADDEDEDEDWNDDGSPEDQAAFMRDLEIFYRERAIEFKPPKFYGIPLNCLKLWRSVIRLGGYDRVTGSKLWRQVGESFNPPKTCTTVSWTFRIFYEKALLEYERHKTQSGKLQLPIAALPEAGVDNEGNGNQTPGSGRARRDAAARAMQGWHEQRLLGCGEVGEPIVKDKNANNTPKREKNFKSIGSIKHKRPNEVEHPSKVARTETSKQLVTTVVDLGPPADWVKINVRETRDCFEIYALVPGLLREEVRVQSDPAGRLVITGQPEQLDNPWGITAFKKVVSLPARIDPLQTSAVVSLHGRLFVRVPFA
ncbi:AT-rich interactive domain-containing protein 5-like [Solanum stenotomum]|uniref:AT-rich interactive domain-containing protein 5-like n=1 Tax=Solanum stenotomum TaxID=172797 RepID=UPI0020D10D69|nr:AT-rich interactive domain-containing protein 5-like [Solanum stenotomum]XP_049390469.1 AT-rich interactive domain-containing protein 5-like [Solanum stenotomum]